MTKHQLKALLRRHGFTFHRPGRGTHQIWRHEVTGRKITVAKHDHFGDQHALRNFTDNLIQRRH